MITTLQVRKLTKAEIDAVVRTGLISRVAEKTGASIQTVSRVLKRQTKRPKREIVLALDDELSRLDQQARVA
jgi:hypothetical protein